MATILDGKALSAQCKETIRKEVEELAAKGCRPGMAVVLVGENPASKVYVRNKEKDCQECGIYSAMYHLPEETTEKELLELLDTLNHDASIHGILVQLPLPKQINSQRVIEAIDPQKDVDAFHPTNVGYLTQGMPRFAPCTPAGIVKLMEAYKIDPAGKHCVVIGRSNIVGKPMSMLLLRENGTVTTCHSHTADLREVTKRADVLVVALGRPKFIDASYVKEGAAVIDVGIHRQDNGKLCGDVDFDSVEPVAGAITPVPGGVGPMTIAMLMNNCVEAALMKK